MRAYVYIPFYLFIAISIFLLFYDRDAASVVWVILSSITLGIAIFIAANLAIYYVKGVIYKLSKRRK
jgi:hypothetical protein